MYVAKNGTEISVTRGNAAIGGDETQIMFGFMQFPLSTNDFIETFVENTSNGDDFEATNGALNIEISL